EEEDVVEPQGNEEGQRGKIAEKKEGKVTVDEEAISGVSEKEDDDAEIFRSSVSPSQVQKDTGGEGVEQGGSDLPFLHHVSQVFATGEKLNVDIDSVCLQPYIVDVGDGSASKNTVRHKQAVDFERAVTHDSKVFDKMSQSNSKANFTYFVANAQPRAVRGSVDGLNNNTNKKQEMLGLNPKSWANIVSTDEPQYAVKREGHGLKPRPVSKNLNLLVLQILAARKLLKLKVT
ncbi:hypothetical protein U1Q18_002560, partial [Sarracenia purpurea var. burkii]